MLILLFGFLGGLALFLYGMELMGDGLRQSAGEKLQKILESLTSVPAVGVLTGLVITSILQSSSATTVMSVSLVNAGLMTLKQAFSVVMGANIGTTVTAQLIAFNLTTQERQVRRHGPLRLRPAHAGHEAHGPVRGAPAG